MHFARIGLLSRPLSVREGGKTTLRRKPSRPARMSHFLRSFATGKKQAVMIRKEEVFAIGTANKPHGVGGELSISFTTDVFDTAEADYFVLDMDGILVPFYIESYRFRSDTTALLKLEGIDTQEQARELAGHTLYLPVAYRERMDDDGFTLHHLVGFTLADRHAGTLGPVTAIDDSTANVLFQVDHAGRELLVPVSDDFIERIDPDTRTIHTCLPEGLIDL